MTASLLPVQGLERVYRVLAGNLVCVGFLRREDTGAWVARTRGDPDGRTAAAIRRFPEDAQFRAIQWLCEREQAPAERGRSSYAAPGRRRAAL
jgi:hypothetical protein